MQPELQSSPSPAVRSGESHGHPLLVAACFLVIATYVVLCDLKGVNTDEGIRLNIMNAGRPFLLNTPPAGPDWSKVLATGQPFAYQPLYFLIQHTVMCVARTQNDVILKLVNIGFLWLSLQGLLALSRDWRLPPRLFLVGVFSFNAYLFMHVLQIREYILGVAFYIWSTWLVLRLLERSLSRVWADIAWFAAYGFLLVFGFYVQTWIVFVALAQGLFLAVWRRADRWRFYAHLTLSYLIVLTTTIPFLRANGQRVDVGRWGQEGSALLPQLSDGFHLVISGHQPGHSAFASFLFWFWLAVIGVGGALLFNRKAAANAPETCAALRREGPLMLLSMAFPLAFQIGYFYRLDNLSVWPRYFVIHYFFLFWLLASAVRYLDELGRAATVSLRTRRLSQAAVGTVLAVMLASAAYQTRSYYRYPFLDSGMNHQFNWRTVAAEVARVIRPDDVMLVHEFLNRSALTFTRQMPNRVLMLTELDGSDLRSVQRVVYLEPAPYLTSRDALATRLAGLGFGKMQPLRIHNTDGRDFMAGWQLLIFQR